MEDDYMSDGTEGSEAPEESREPAEGRSKTALLPIDFFQGKPLEPGTTCSVKVEEVYEDQVSVSYVPHEAEESAEGNSEYDMMG